MSSLTAFFCCNNQSLSCPLLHNSRIMYGPTRKYEEKLSILLSLTPKPRSIYIRKYNLRYEYFPIILDISYCIVLELFVFSRLISSWNCELSFESLLARDKTQHTVFYNFITVVVSALRTEAFADGKLLFRALWWSKDLQKKQCNRKFSKWPNKGATSP